MPSTEVRIRQLSPLLANQISAGEVIERPASVVKELLENALDAAADSIHIEVDFGGLNQIKVSDNGIGIVADDLILAISAHATSKISQVQDLSAITSMGFRGEALSSIAAVSRFSLSSRTATQMHAMRLRTENSVVEILPCARTQGTTVEARDLFFNAPVRKKFLKSERNEYQAIEMVVKQFALSAPRIALTLHHNGKQTLALASATCEQTKLERIRKILGKAFIEHAIYLEVERAGMHLHGWVSGEICQYSQSNKQWTYINQRIVKDKFIQHAIKQAYENKLHPGRNPGCLLYLAVPPQELDVNVHPTKREVRFQHPRLVHDLLSSQILRALTEPTVPPAFSHGDKPVSPHVLREAYVHAPTLAQPRPISSTSGIWVPLNGRFVLLFLGREPYLVDVTQLYYHRAIAWLKQSQPIARRPLLVPLIYTLAQKNNLFDDYQPHLATLGVEIDLFSETQAVIRSTPLAIPHLDLQQVIKKLNTLRTSDYDTLLTLLADCQTVDATQLSEEEQHELLDFLHQTTPCTTAIKSWCVPMDYNGCQDFLALER